MERSAVLMLITWGLVLAVAACGAGEKAPPKTDPADILPVRIDGTDWVRGPELEHFAGDSLFEYIDGAAEMYHKYGFVEVTVATYSKHEATITADLYLFEGPDKAFGLYSTLRPDEPDTVSLGAEGFMFGPNLVYVKGPYVVNVYTYDDFDGAVAAVRSVAGEIETNLPGTAAKPAVFTRFPDGGRMAHTEKIFAEGFLGYGFLTDVYTVDYASGSDVVRLFFTRDPDAAKFGRLVEATDAGPGTAPVWSLWTLSMTTMERLQPVGGRVTWWAWWASSRHTERPSSTG
jgi:hypothetical protein